MSCPRPRILAVLSLLTPVALGGLLLLALAAGCGPDEDATPPDAPSPPAIPTSPAGVFAVTSELDLAAPASAAPVLATLTAMTDGPDDPSRFVVDHMIATLPDGAIKTIAEHAAPYVAAYVNARLAEVAPRLSPGLAALTTGLSRLAGHLGTVETLRVDSEGNATRTITAVRIAAGPASTTIPLADTGLPDLAASLRVVLGPGDRIALRSHGHTLPYGALLRLGLARAVVPTVEPGARDLGAALAAIVDCDRMSATMADRIGVGGAAVYRAACHTAMTAVASEIDAALTAIDDVPAVLTLAGAADVIDRDRDGTIDELRAGTWIGSLQAGAASTPLRAGRFTATIAPSR